MLNPCPYRPPRRRQKDPCSRYSYDLDQVYTGQESDWVGGDGGFRWRGAYERQSVHGTVPVHISNYLDICSLCVGVHYNY